MQQSLLDIQAACEFLGGTKPVHPSTVWRWIKARRISPPKNVGPNIVRFELEVLKADVEAGCATRPKQTEAA